jgi:multicomponent Na+:H+ antiporter subunit B
MKGMSVIVQTVARWVVGFVILYGLWLTIYGHISPGGGFSGGVVVAAGYIMVMLAFGSGQANRFLPRPVGKTLDSLAAAAFLLLALLGLWIVSQGRQPGTAFFANFVQANHPGSPHEVFNAGIIPLANLAIAVKVAVSFAVAFGVMSACRLKGGGQFESEEE